MDAWLRLAKHNYSFTYIDKVLGFYELGSENTSNLTKNIKAINISTIESFMVIISINIPQSGSGKRFLNIIFSYLENFQFLNILNKRFENILFDFLQEKEKILSIQAPKLTLRVVVSLYNRMDVFPSVLESLFNQTIASDRYTIIVIDDCSSDGALTFLRSVKNKYRNFHYIVNETNMGPSTARNLGLNSCEEDVVLFLDADMVVEPNFLELHLAAQSCAKDKILQLLVILFIQIFI